MLMVLTIERGRELLYTYT